jgi:hypothetical protein
MIQKGPQIFSDLWGDLQDEKLDTFHNIIDFVMHREVFLDCSLLPYLLVISYSCSLLVHVSTAKTPRGKTKNWGRKT